MSSIQPSTASPFEAIRREDEHGEFWSARDLQSPLGYVEWRKFEDSIERAMAAAENSGHPAADHFGGADKMVELGSGAVRVVCDYRLTRYGAYLTAMNGDPRKPEVAAAQTYFAVKTREAEVGSTELDEIVVAEKYLAALRDKKALAAQVARLEPKAQAFDAWLNGKGVYLIDTVANIIGTGHKALWLMLYDEGILISKGTRRRQPFALPKTRGWFSVKTHDQARTNGHAVNTTYVTPFGCEQIRLLATRRGLIEPQLALVAGEG